MEVIIGDTVEGGTVAYLIQKESDYPGQYVILLEGEPARHAKHSDAKAAKAQLLHTLTQIAGDKIVRDKGGKAYEEHLAAEILSRKFEVAQGKTQR